MDNLFSKNERHHKNQHRSNGNRNETVPRCFFNFVVILSPVIVADNWCCCNSSSHVKRDKEIVIVHDDCYSRYPIFSLMIAPDPVASIAFLPIENTKKASNIITLPQGQAASIYHYGTYQSMEYSYKKLLNYCKDHNLEIISDSYEFCINDYISSGDEREYITEIFFYVR